MTPRTLAKPTAFLASALFSTPRLAHTGAGAAPGFTAGVLLATAVLHGLGIAAGRAGRSFGPLRRGFGWVCVGVGVYLMTGV